MSTFIHTFKPGSPPAPTILVCHGTGGDENSLVWLAEALFPGAAILSPRGNVSEYGAPRFFRRFAEGVFDLDDIRFRANELADFVASSATEYGFDPNNVWGMGYSNGANILAATLMLRPETLGATVLLRAMVTLEDVGAPNLVGKSIIISEGLYDAIVPTENAERLVRQLERFGATVDVNWHDGGHNLDSREIAKLGDMIHERLILNESTNPPAIS